jgi:tRNA (guanine37-N1)-methyltransferase
MTDDVPYGGGEGMVMKPAPFFSAIRAVSAANDMPVVLLTPQGRQFSQAIAEDFAQYPQLILLCGHYEGVDERVRQHLVTDEISIGDYVLTGGELAAMVMVDAIARFIPGVLGAAEGAYHDSFASGLLEGPQYTRPAEFELWAVPDVLRSGNHAAIARWQREKALERTLKRRPDMLATITLDEQDRIFLEKIQ